jgi:hypothetical protein
MSLHHNPKIVTDGLVLAYDMDNVAKSFKGKPTTNLTTNTPTQAGWQGNYSLVSSDTKTFDVTTQQNNSSTTSAWRTWYWDVSSYEGSTITISGDVQFLEANDAEFLHITIGQGNTGSFPVHIAGSSAADKVQISTRPDQKIHMTWTGTINSAGLVGFTQWINNVTADGGNSTLRISNIQIEVSGFETPFVNGTRSNTQALLDMSKSKYTITASSLTYNSDGTFEFDGTSDYITIPEPNVGLSPNSWTIEGWINPENQRSFFITPNSNGIDNFLEYDNTNKRIAVKVCESADTNERYFYSNSQSVPLNTWSHFSASISNLNVKLYINGVNHVDQTETISMSDWSGIWHIGRRANGTFYLDGSLSNIKIYNRALSAAEIKQNFNATRGRFGI